MFTNRNHNVDEQGFDGLLLMGIFTNVATLVHTIHELVGKYIMEHCDVDLRYSFILKRNVFNHFQSGNVNSQTRTRTVSNNSSSNICHRVSSTSVKEMCSDRR